MDCKPRKALCSVLHSLGWDLAFPLKLMLIDSPTVSDGFNYNKTVLEMIHFVMSQLEEKFDSAGKKFYQCKHCEFGFIKKEKVRQHIETVHGDGMGIRYNCDYCEKNYKSHSNLRTHVSSNHRQNLISTWS